jgi:hypothetical protein
MRALTLRLAMSFGLAVGAAPAIAQVTPGLQPPRTFQQEMVDQMRAAQLSIEIDQAARAAVIQQNELSNLEAQVRTQQNLANLQAQAISPKLPPVPQGGVAPQIDVSGLASIPDPTLAASNARVKAAAENRP